MKLGYNTKSKDPTYYCLLYTSSRAFRATPATSPPWRATTMLAEASTRDISKASRPEGFSGSMEVARQGGEVAGVARKALEERTGAPVITAQNAAQMNTLVVGMIEEAAALPTQAEADDKE